MKARSADLSFGVMPPQRKTLSVAMIAMNEEANLPRTLESVKWADEIIVVDSGSRDRTLRLRSLWGEDQLSRLWRAWRAEECSAGFVHERLDTAAGCG